MSAIIIAYGQKLINEGRNVTVDMLDFIESNEPLITYTEKKAVMDVPHLVRMKDPKGVAMYACFMAARFNGLIKNGEFQINPKDFIDQIEAYCASQL